MQNLKKIEEKVIKYVKIMETKRVGVLWGLPGRFILFHVPV